ncbi:hypothetical protein Tco_0415810 [Tanacetum coccineum]
MLRRMPRGGIELVQFTALLEAIRDVSITDKQDAWKWALTQKVSILSLDKLPTLVNLDRKGCPEIFGLIWLDDVI